MNTTTITGPGIDEQPKQGSDDAIAELHDRIRELEAQVANQIATIDALTRGGYTGKRRPPPDAAEGGGR